MSTQPDTTTTGGTSGIESGSDSRTGGVRGTASAATRRAGETLDGARSRASEAYGAARERTSSAYSTARQKTSKSVESYPEIAIAGGLALGAILAAVLPKTQREQEVLGDYGRRINDSAREAVRAATEAGRSKLEEAGLTPSAAPQKLSEVAASAGQAAASAAADSVKGNSDEQQQ